MDKQSILSKADLFNLHSIQTTPIGYNVNRYERLHNGNIDCGERTKNCIGYDMDKNPEYFIPVMDGKKPVFKTKTNPRYVCICGQKSTTICLTIHYESGNVIWVGTECINKNRDNIEKKIKDLGYKDADLIKRLEYTQEAYDKYHRWDLDKDKLTCMGNCDDVLYKTNVKGHKKNWNGNDNCLRCFKCDEYDKAKNCLCCNKKIFCKDVYNKDNSKLHLYRLDYCDDCGNNYKLHTFTSNIDFYNPMYKEVVNKNKIIPLDGDKWGVRGHLLKLPSNIRVNILGSKNYDSQEEDPNWEDCEFYKYDINDDLLNQE
jgi:hypothetical protein